MTRGEIIYREVVRMQRWSQFSLGLLAGIVVVLLTVVILQNREPQAHAVTQSVDNSGSILMGIGASTQNQNDIVWLLVKHPAPKRPPGADTGVVASKDERMTLCCYQVTNQARSMRLVATRDISFDIDILEMNNDKPSVRNIIEELKKVMPKEPSK
jgi:hypothetical protein